MRIQHKLAIAMFAFGSASLIAISAIYFFHLREGVLTDARHSMRRMAEERAEYLETLLKEKAKTCTVIANSPTVARALARSNSRYAEFSDAERQQRISDLNAKWMETPDAADTFFAEYLRIPAADYLRRLQESIPGEFGEIFITNRYGVTVATTGKLTTLSHGHKYWWVACHHEGKGRVFFDDRGYDESVKGYVVGVVVPIIENEEIVGVLKCNLNVKAVLNEIVATLGRDDLGKVQLARTGGAIVLEEGAKPLSGRVTGVILDEMNRGEAGSREDPERHEIAAYAPVYVTLGSENYGFGGSYESLDHIEGNTGESWFILISQDLDLALTKVADTEKWIVGIGVLVIGTMALTALIVSGKMSRPVIELTEHAKRIGSGDLGVQIDIGSKDELGVLGAAFNKMVNNLRQTMVSRDSLIEEVEERTSDLKRANEQLRKEISERKQAEETVRKTERELLNRQRKEKELVEAELDKTREELVKKTRLATLGQLTATISHEIRNPLGTIRSAVYSVAKDVRGRTPRVDRALDRAERNIVRCDQIIEDLLDYTRTREPKLTPTDVDRWLDTMLDEQEIPEQISVIRSLNAGIELDVDREQLRRCVVNLLTNACQAMDQTQADGARLTVETATEDDRLLVSVGDTGCGIDREGMDRIFEPLYTTKGFGVGLGLFVVDQLMRQLGGGITFQSEPGRGTTASLWLPLPTKKEP